MDFVDTPEALAATFLRFSEYTRKGFDANLTKAYRVVEISAFIVVANIVGAMVIAMYLPIFLMAGAVG